MIVIKLILFTLIISGLHCIYPDKVICASEKCDKPISKANTLLGYNSPETGLISFRGNKEAIVYMKSASTNSDLWYVNIGGNFGFAPSKFLREKKILVNNPEFIVPYEPKANENVQPDKVRQAHEVVEGTTIYTTEATVKNIQQDVTTPHTISSNEALTPPLQVTTEKPDIDENNQDINKINDNAEDNSPISDPFFKENSDVNISSSLELPDPIETKSIEEVKIIEISTENSPETTEKDVINNLLLSEPINNEQLEKEHSGLAPEEYESTISSTTSSEVLLEVPEKELTLTESTETDSNQENVLLPNLKDEIVQLIQNNSNQVNNVSNDDENLSHESISQESEHVQPILDGDDSVSVVDSAQTDQNTLSPLEESTIQATGMLSTLEPPATETEIPPQQDIPQPLESIPVLQTTIPPPVTTEAIPAFYPQETQAIPDAVTIPPLNTHQSVPEDHYNSQHGLSDNMATTESPPLYTEQYSEQQNDPESLLLPDPNSSSETAKENSYTNSNDQAIDENSSTRESHNQDENTEGYFSNIYSTVADIWPSTTETPPPIYNTEDYPTYETEQKEPEKFSFMKYILSIYYSVMGTSEETKALFASVGETCYTDEYCDGTTNNGTNRLLTFLLTTASSVLLFTLGYYYIDNRRQDGRLIGQINSLQRDLLFTSKECEILKEQLSSTKNKLAGIEDNSFGMDDMVQSLKEEINDLKATNDRLRNSLDDNEKLLRVSENTAGELQNTLSEVENTLSELLAERAHSEEQIIELNGKVQAFEEELISVSRDRDNFQLKYVSAESALEELKKQKKQLEEVSQQLSESRNIIELQKHEINALKDAIKDLKSGTSSNVDVTSLIDHTEIKAKLSKALEEKKTIESKYEVENKERVRLAEELQTTQETLHTTSQNATEALTRLDVLGKYFQERESELMKELNAKESLWLSKQGESASTVEKIELLQQEVQRYKEKCDALTLELAEQESSRRTALSAVETRAHAAWLEARGARRDADAARDEAAALRRKLAALSTIAPADGAVSPHLKVSSPLESVENPVMPPPLPPMFLPPPLLPPLPRPPPLGRLPSPHPPRYGDRRYSPESRYSPGGRYSPDSRYSPETVRYSPDSRYSPRSRRSAYSPRSRRRSRSRERYENGRGSRSRNGPADTETEYNSDSPSREPRRRGRYSRHSGPSSGSGCSSESDK